MSTKTPTKTRDFFPSVFDDFFNSWDEWFGSNKLPLRPLTVPAVNIMEEKDNYQVTLAAPGMAKDDFNIDVEENILTISASKKDEKEEKDKKFTRKEYNYSSFSRSFTLPEDVLDDKIQASYENGVLKLILPKSQEGNNITVRKTIKVN